MMAKTINREIERAPSPGVRQSLPVLIVAAAVCTLPAIAGELEIPHEFTAGTPAVAAEVNANFDAVEVAVDDNAADIAALNGAQAATGLWVSVDGTRVGRLIQAAPMQVAVVEAPPNSGTWQVAEAAPAPTAPLLNLISPLGYRFLMATSDFDHPLNSEGSLDAGILMFDDTACAGTKYFPVEGDTGYFTNFVRGEGRSRPLKRWAARQGFAFGSPDPNDTTPAYMVRRGTPVETVALGSLLIYSVPNGAPLCVTLTNIPNYDAGNPLHVNQTVIPVEANDEAVSGVSTTMGGEITLDF